jgi:hypothetical protein
MSDTIADIVETLNSKPLSKPSQIMECAAAYCRYTFFKVCSDSGLDIHDASWRDENGKKDGSF